MEKLLDIVAEVLNVDKSQISLNTSRDEIAAWDSLNHVRLIAELEEQLNITIPFEAVSGIKKVSDILEFVKD
ncbi:acyl carrier protein [Acetivibrio clariflavus]|uniref:Acyl carrier protein n=1 Tax=Acetivibrio clariflavus (strain DSM 19732 / NBRC 101661 / EBR45) TaxID=720554 RepID=G8LTK8_ACECE|nr:acyl carrier protein [Acetivibrio clariflavus]AEV70518.1 acyl carrier protein [Acetivibrio clariflavus DSM 19732]